MASSVILNNVAAGVYGTATSAFSNPTIPPFRAVMIIGSSGGTEAINTPVLFSTPADFTNQFPSSPEENAVKAFLSELSTYTDCDKYFIRTGIARRYGVTVNSVAAQAYTLNINGTSVSHTATGTETTTQLATAIAAAVNNNVTVSPIVTASSSGAVVTIRTDNPISALTITVSAGNMTGVVTTPTTPDTTDYLYTIQNTFDSLRDPLFVAIMPAMAGLTPSNYLSVVTALEGVVSSMQCFAFIDCTSAVASGTVQAAVTEKTGLPGSRHLGYYWPHVIDLNNNVVPSSSVVAGAAMRRYAQVGEGISQPPAGSKCRFKSVKGLSTVSTLTQAELTAANKINIILQRKNIGYVAWDAYTTSTDSNFKFIPDTLITSVIFTAIKDSLEPYLFRSMGSRGQTIDLIRSTIIAVMERALNAGYLSTLGGRAYIVECDATTQDLAALDEGLVLAKIAYSTAGMVRQIAFILAKSPLGKLELTISSV